MAFWDIGLQKVSSITLMAKKAGHSAFKNWKKVKYITNVCLKYDFVFYFNKESEIMNSKNIFWNFSTSNFVKSGFTKFFRILNHCVIGFLTSDIIKRLNLSSSSTNFSFISSVKRLKKKSRENEGFFLGTEKKNLVKIINYTYPQPPWR